MFASDIRNWLAVSSFLTLACGSEAAQPSLDWQVRFACEADRARSTSLELRIHEGACSEQGAELFRATLSPGEPAPAPEALREGAYSFLAIAKQDTFVVASACSELRIPASAQLATTLASGDCDASAPPSDEGSAASEPDAQANPDGGIGRDAAPAPDAELDASDGAGPSEDAAVVSDATIDACDCSACDVDCSCRSVSCFTTRLFLTYAAAWSPASGLSAGAGAIARVGWAPGANAGRRLVDPPAPQLVLSQDSFASSAEIDAFALLSDGRYLFSTRDDEIFRGEAFDDDDLIAYEPLSQAVTRHLDLGSLLGSVSGSDVDVDALHVAASGELYFSVDAPVKAGNATFAAADLLRLGNSGVERLVIGADAWAGRDLESLGVDPVSGHFIASFAGSGRIGDGPSGLSFGPGDAVLLAFGPGQPYAAGYQLWLQGSAEFSSTSGTLSALHCGE